VRYPGKGLSVNCVMTIGEGEWLVNTV